MSPAVGFPWKYLFRYFRKFSRSLGSRFRLNCEEIFSKVFEEKIGLTIHLLRIWKTFCLFCLFFQSKNEGVFSLYFNKKCSDEIHENDHVQNGPLSPSGSLHGSAENRRKLFMRCWHFSHAKRSTSILSTDREKRAAGKSWKNRGKALSRKGGGSWMRRRGRAVDCGGGRRGRVNSTDKACGWLHSYTVESVWTLDRIFFTFKAYRLRLYFQTKAVDWYIYSISYLCKHI